MRRALTARRFVISPWPACADAFRVMDGGAWFYVEADNGFPFDNLRALVETIALWR